MSFTVKVKEELLSLASRDKNELSAMIKMSGSLGLASSGLTLSVTTENAKIARHSMSCCRTFIRSSQKSVTIRRPTCARIEFIQYF